MVLLTILILNYFLTLARRNFKKLDLIYKAIEMTRLKLNKDKSLISFVGAPDVKIYVKYQNNKNEIDLSRLNDQNLEINKS